MPIQLHCECEHASHFDEVLQHLHESSNKKHPYGENGFLDLQEVKTPHGTFHVCRDCAETCLMDFYKPQE